MLIDDAWATVGSANLHRYSLFGNSEMNAAIFSPETVRSFRVALFAEHLGLDTSELDDLTAIGLFRQIAKANREKLLNNIHQWQGLVFNLEVKAYGKVAQF